MELKAWEGVVGESGKEKARGFVQGLLSCGQS